MPHYQHHGIVYQDFDHPRYRYRLLVNYGIQTDIIVPETVALPGKTPAGIPFAFIKPDGWLEVQGGYAWDGPSGPTFDTEDAMRGSLVHDALYQMMRESDLPLGYRLQVDNLFYALCVEDGMPFLRAWYFWLAVRVFGEKAARPVAK